MQKEVIYRHLIGKSTPEEELAIKEWYYRNPDECQKEIDEVRFLFEGALLHYAIGKPEARTMRKPRGLRLNIRRVMRVAAVIALLVSCMFGMRELAFHGVSGQMTAFEVPAGQRIAIDLSDGTRVWLNSESRIEYPAVFGRRSRKVKISGEAMFDVVPDANRPFTVETFASTIEVLGTKFNVEADEAAGRFSTTLIRGKVKVSTEGQEVVLHPDQTVDLVNGNLVVVPTDDPATLLWTEGILSMKNVSFEELMTKFEKLYDVRIVYRCQNMPVIEFSSGKIRVADGIDHALRVLQHVSKFDYERDEQSNIIYIK